MPVSCSSVKHIITDLFSWVLIGVVTAGSMCIGSECHEYFVPQLCVTHHINVTSVLG